jgi:hypothetical protein
VLAEKAGKSTGIGLSGDNRLFIRIRSDQYLMLEFEESDSHTDGEIIREFCRLRWTTISGDGVESGVESGLIRYRSEELREGESQLTKIGGSDSINILGFKFRWSYASRKAVFIYLPTNSQYTIDNVEQEEAADPSPAP